MSTPTTKEAKEKHGTYTMEHAFVRAVAKGHGVFYYAGLKYGVREYAQDRAKQLEAK